MLQRKINAIISLISTFLLMDHAIFHAAWMLSRGSIEKSASFMSWTLAGLMLIHAFISIDMGISAHANAEKRPCKQYPKMNVSTNIQRISGILLIIFTVLHILGTIGIMQPPKIIHAILPPLFFAIALMHAAISTSKAFITLGIGNARLVKVVDIAMKVICTATLIADVIGFYLYRV